MVGSIKDCAVLNNGVKMPWLGFGVFQVEDGPVVERSVEEALGRGYRSIDTAAVYGNEIGVGNAIRNSSVPREDIFLTTKVWNSDQRSQRVAEAFDESLERLGVDYVDLYLIHWPVDGCYVETWSELERIYDSGRAKAIGVSNFMTCHLDELLPVCEVVPAVNQVEFHPLLVQPELLQYCREHGIQPQAWSPLMQGQFLDDQTLGDIAAKHRKTTAQVVLRWDLQRKVITIPKSVHADRIAENAAIFDFELSDDEMRRLDAMDRGHRCGPDPYDFSF